MGERSAVLNVMRSDDPDIENTRDNPEAVIPVKKTLTLSGNVFDVEPEVFAFKMLGVRI